MRRILRAGVTLTAAAAVILSLSGASLAGAAVEPEPHQFMPSVVLPPYREVPRILSDAQLVKAAAPERAALAAQAKARALANARAASAAKTVARRFHAAAAGGRSVHVWTSGFQAQVNACRGGVDLTSSYHVRTVGEHWSCGGAAFPETPGSIVTFTGLDAGTYRVIGLVATLNAFTAHTSSIPRGYQMLFQTCRGGNSRSTIFIALARV